MAEILETEQAQTPVQKTKLKAEKIKLKMVGAASCKFDDYSFKKEDIIETDSNHAERILSTGLFVRI